MPSDLFGDGARVTHYVRVEYRTRHKIKRDWYLDTSDGRCYELLEEWDMDKGCFVVCDLYVRKKALPSMSEVWRSTANVSKITEWWLVG